MTRRRAVGSTVAVLAGGALLAGFVRVATQQPAPSATPFFTADQLGLIKVLIVIVLPIVGALGLFIWRLARGKEQQDLNGLGARITTLDADVKNLAEKVSHLGAQIGDDRLAYMSQIHADTTKTTAALADMREKLGRVDERVCTSTDLKTAIADAMSTGLRELLRDIKRGGVADR